MVVNSSAPPKTLRILQALPWRLTVVLLRSAPSLSANHPRSYSLSLLIFSQVNRLNHSLWLLFFFCAIASSYVTLQPGILYISRNRLFVLQPPSASILQPFCAQVFRTRQIEVWLIESSHKHFLSFLSAHKRCKQSMRLIGLRQRALSSVHCSSYWQNTSLFSCVSVSLADSSPWSAKLGVCRFRSRTATDEPYSPFLALALPFRANADSVSSLLNPEVLVPSSFSDAYRGHPSRVVLFKIYPPAYSHVSNIVCSWHSVCLNKTYQSRTSSIGSLDLLLLIESPGQHTDIGSATGLWPDYHIKLSKLFKITNGHEIGSILAKYDTRI